jgi:hypothetical protein
MVKGATLSSSHADLSINQQMGPNWQSVDPVLGRPVPATSIAWDGDLRL